MRRTAIFPVSLAASALLGVLFAAPAAAQELEPGKVIDKVVCSADPGLSYALYLPPGFDRGRVWPVLFLFDPGARGPAAVEAFRAAAQEFGWILVGSNDSRNGPAEANARAALAVWEDARRRLPLDEKRVYAGGFSGGARVASMFPRVAGRAIAGLIGCGAGLSQGLEPADVGAGAYFGLTGLADFNYEEMRRLDRAFDPTGLSHRFLFFDGGHDWPDPAFCARAVEWLEVAAMKAGLRPNDKALVEAAVARELEEAAAFEQAGRVYWAVDRLEAGAALAAGSKDVQGLQERIADLRSRRDYAAFARAEAKRTERAAAFRREFGGAFGAVEDDEAGGGAAVGAVLQEMRIGILKREARSAKTPEARELASRLLFDFSFAAQARAFDLYAARDLVRAGAYFDLAIAACEAGLPRERYLYFNRACVAALAGDKRGALKFLSTAVDKGFSDSEALETSEALRAIQGTDAFREILMRIRKGQTRTY